MIVNIKNGKEIFKILKYFLSYLSSSRSCDFIYLKDPLRYNREVKALTLILKRK